MTNSMSSAQRVAAARAIARLDRGGRVAHKPKRASYASGANREYYRDQGRKRGVVGVDIDFNPNRQRTPFGHHQLHPTKRDAWFDPKHQINDRHSCRVLDDAQMHRLRVRYQGRNRPILTVHQAAQVCVSNGLIPCPEAKFMHDCYLDPQWWFDEFVKGWAPGLVPVIMTLPKTGLAGIKVLAAAHEVGLPTMWLWRGPNLPGGFAQHVDLVKSRPGRGIYRV